MDDEFNNQLSGNSRVGAGNSTDMDERVASMMHLQQLQQKHIESQSVANANAQFRRGLEELVRDHLNTCMVLAGSSSNNNVLDHVSDDCHPCHYHNSPRGKDDGQVLPSNGQIRQTGITGYCNDQFHLNREQQEEDGDDQLRDRDRHSNLVRRQASILSQWAVCHAQQMITTIERQTRETELLALAGLHAVSMLDASFLREPSQRSESAVSLENPVERPRRASSLVQMWRELEEEQRAENARTEVDIRMSFQAPSENCSENAGQLNDNHQTYNTEVPEIEMNTGVREELQYQGQENSNDEDSLRVAIHSGNNAWDGTERTVGDELLRQDLERNTSPVNGTEREPVRQIVQRLSTENGVRDNLSNGIQNDNRNLLGENERERVRELAREWVRVTSQQSLDAAEGRRNALEINELQSGSVRRQAREREAMLEGASTADPETYSRDRFSRDAQWLRHRQAVLDLLVRIERERQDELQGLLEHRAVSDFAYRNRLQSFLRLRFLQNGTTNGEVPASSAATELGQLRQRRAVSGLREGFRFRLERILLNQANRRLSEQTTAEDESQRRILSGQQIDSSVSEASGLQDRELAPHVAGRDWQGNAASRRVSELQSLEEATAYNMELQELLARRSVSNLLASEFRDRLDQLIRSFLHTRGRTPVAWDFARAGRVQQLQQSPPPPPPLPPQQHAHQQEQRQQQAQVQVPDNNTGSVNVVGAAAFVASPPPPPPPPPPHPLWQQELQQESWASQAFQRPSFMDWEIMNELRADVLKLQQGMSHLYRTMGSCMSDLQRNMEASMETQLELQRAVLDIQRSVRQEVAGALQRVYDGRDVPEEAINGSNWVAVQRGVCCMCCDKNIDSLLYRCGHMCTCLKCARELAQNSGRCPMCRAPIVEVVRAFTVV